MSPMMAKELAMSAPAPQPWSPRKMMSWTMFWEGPPRRGGREVGPEGGEGAGHERPRPEAREPAEDDELDHVLGEAGQGRRHHEDGDAAHQERRVPPDGG